MGENKTLYVRVTDDLYNKTVEKAKQNGMTLAKYVTFCIVNFKGSAEKPNIPPPEKCKKNKVLYCRISEKQFQSIKEKADSKNLKISQFVVLSVLEANRIAKNVSETTKTKSKVLYCRVSSEFHDMVMKKCEEANMSVTDYIIKCIENDKAV